MSEQKKTKKISKIVVDRDLCIGAAACVVVSPKVFQMDAENKAYIVDLEGDSADAVRMAAESCPVKAVLLYDEEGKQVYP